MDYLSRAVLWGLSVVEVDISFFMECFKIFFKTLRFSKKVYDLGRKYWSCCLQNA